MLLYLWRGSLLPLGREAAPLHLMKKGDCCAVQREQAPSPQVCISGLRQAVVQALHGVLQLIDGRGDQ